MGFEAPVPPVTLLSDSIGCWPALGLADAGSAASVGIVGWWSATKAELAEFSSLSARERLPTVAVLDSMPSVRGARALAERLEGVVMRDTLDATLLATLVAVDRGQSVHPVAIRGLAKRASLSPRERQMLAMVVLGLSNAELAARLYVTESNVKSHLSSAFRKLGVRSRGEAVELILDEESGVGMGILKIGPEERIG